MDGLLSRRMMNLIEGGDAFPNVAIYWSYPNGCGEVQMNDSEIQRALVAQSPQEACRSLTQLAKDRGGPDNITLQVARVT